jgi:hypothetical protein
MRDDGFPAFERFLVEDVILTLGNLRSTLAWLCDPDTAASPEVLRGGLARLSRQIEGLEDRARSICRGLPGPAPPALAAADAESHIPLDRLLRDAAGGAEAPPIFRTRRAACG